MHEYLLTLLKPLKALQWMIVIIQRRGELVKDK
jgi:hypothetical protein